MPIPDEPVIEAPEERVLRLAVAALAAANSGAKAYHEPAAALRIALILREVSLESADQARIARSNEEYSAERQALAAALRGGKQCP